MSSFHLDFGDVSAIAAFAGVAYKFYQHWRGPSPFSDSGAGTNANPARQSRMQSLASASFSGGSLAAVSTKLKREATKRSTKEVSSADERVSHIIKMVNKYGNDPDVRKITGDLLTGRMDVWGRVRSDDQFYEYRQQKLHSNGQPWAVREKDWPAEVARVFRFNRNMVRYTRDPSTVDTYTGPLRTMAFFNIGDCDCYTILASSMLKSVGYPQKVRIIWLRGAPTWGHIYLMVGMPPMGPVKWVPFDASIDKPLGTQAPPAMVYKYKDFVLP